MENVSIKTIASYAGHSVNNNKSVSLTLKFTYDTITKYIQSIQMLNENVEIVVRLGNDNIKLGSFMINKITIDHDGEGKIKFNSQVDFVELNNISKIINSEVFRIALKAKIDIEEQEENEKLPF